MMVFSAAFGAANIPSLLLFFGALGILGQYTAWGHPLSQAIAGAVGITFAFGLHRLACLLHGQQAGSGLVMADLVAKAAHVTVAIPAHGAGEVSLEAGLEHTAQIASSVDGAAIPSGSQVVIRAVRDGQLLVEVTQ